MYVDSLGMHDIAQVHGTIYPSASWCNMLASASLVPRPVFFCEEEGKGSGNTTYNDLYRAKECGATNQIALLVIIVRH